MPDTLEDWSNLIQIIALPLALLGLGLAGAQLRKAARTAHAQLILDLDAALESHLDMRQRINRGWQPSSKAERNSLRRYIAVFERMGVLVRLGEIELDSVDQLYGDRLARLLMNDSARNIVKDNPEAWRDFIFLWQKLRAVRQNHRDLPQPPAPRRPGGTSDNDFDQEDGPLQDATAATGQVVVQEVVTDSQVAKEAKAQRISSDGLVVKVDTTGGQEKWEVTLRKLR